MEDYKPEWETQILEIKTKISLLQELQDKLFAELVDSLYPEAQPESKEVNFIFDYIFNEAAGSFGDYLSRFKS